MAAYSSLNKLLSALGETVGVERAYIVKLGCVRLLEFDEPEDCRFPLVEFAKLSAPSAGSDVKELHSEILKSLREHPNIFDITSITDKRAEIRNGSEMGRLVIGNVFSLKVRLPERLQKWRQHWAEESTTAEEFQVISSGSLFAAFAEIEDYPTRTNIGHEYRDLLKEQIRKASSLKCPNFGPSPIHPDFYIVLRQKSADEIPRGSKTYALRNEDILVVSDSEAGAIEWAATNLFRKLEFPLFSFYDLGLGRLRLLYYNTEIFNHFGDLSSGLERLQSISWWHWLQLRKSSLEAKKSLSHVHQRLVDYGAAYLEYSRRRNDLLNRIKEDLIIGEISGYFRHHSETDSELPEALTPALNYFAQELQTSGNIRSTIVAAFLSALAGAFFYALISRFLSN